MRFIFAVIIAVFIASTATWASWQDDFQSGDKKLKQGDLLGAEADFLNALAELEPKQDTNLAYALTRLETVYRKQERWQDAQEKGQRALVLWEQKLGGGTPEAARTLTDLAEISLTLGLFADTENYLRQALVIVAQPRQTTRYGAQFRGRNQYVNNLIADPATIPGSPDAVRVLTGWVNYYLAGNHFGQAEALQKRSIEMLDQKQGYDNAIIFSPAADFIPWGDYPTLLQAKDKLEAIYRLAGK